MEQPNELHQLPNSVSLSNPIERITMINSTMGDIERRLEEIVAKTTQMRPKTLQELEVAITRISQFQGGELGQLIKLDDEMIGMSDYIRPNVTVLDRHFSLINELRHLLDTLRGQKTDVEQRERNNQINELLKSQMDEWQTRVMELMRPQLGSRGETEPRYSLDLLDDFERQRKRWVETMSPENNNSNSTSNNNYNKTKQQQQLLDSLTAVGKTIEIVRKKTDTYEKRYKAFVRTRNDVEIHLHNTISSLALRLSDLGGIYTQPISNAEKSSTLAATKKEAEHTTALCRKLIDRASKMEEEAHRVFCKGYTNKKHSGGVSCDTKLQTLEGLFSDITGLQSSINLEVSIKTEGVASLARAQSVVSECWTSISFVEKLCNDGVNKVEDIQALVLPGMENHLKGEILKQCLEEMQQSKLNCIEKIDELFELIKKETRAYCDKDTGAVMLSDVEVSKIDKDAETLLVQLVSPVVTCLHRLRNRCVAIQSALEMYITSSLKLIDQYNVSPTASSGTLGDANKGAHDIAKASREKIGLSEKLYELEMSLPSSASQLIVSLTFSYPPSEGMIPIMATKDGIKAVNDDKHKLEEGISSNVATEASLRQLKVKAEDISKIPPYLDMSELITRAEELVTRTRTIVDAYREQLTECEKIMDKIINFEALDTECDECDGTDGEEEEITGLRTKITSYSKVNGEGECGESHEQQVSPSIQNDFELHELLSKFGNTSVRGEGMSPDVEIVLSSSDALEFLKSVGIIVDDDKFTGSKTYTEKEIIEFVREQQKDGDDSNMTVLRLKGLCEDKGVETITQEVLESIGMAKEAADSVITAIGLLSPEEFIRVLKL